MMYQEAICHGPMIRGATLCGVAEELRCHILSFLSYHEIICCALVNFTIMAFRQSMR